MRLAGQQTRKRTINATFTITEPREIIKAFLKTIEDRRGWKYPVAAQWFVDEALAVEVAAAMDFYYGGHEMSRNTNEAGEDRWVVSSKGYYHYVGA